MSHSAFDRAGAACAAIVLVTIAHLTLRRIGFDKVYALVSRVPTSAAADTRSAHVDLAIRSVDRACRVICRRAWCVQRTAALTTLLRWYGIDAVMVFGVRRPPFQAHAWTEVDDVPIGEPTDTVIRYTAIRRAGPAAGWRAGARRDMGLSKI